MSDWKVDGGEVHCYKDHPFFSKENIMSNWKVHTIDHQTVGWEVEEVVLLEDEVVDLESLVQYIKALEKLHLELEFNDINVALADLEKLREEYL